MAKSTKGMVIWGFLYLLMLLSLITPLGLITIHLMMIPLVLLFVGLGSRKFSLLFGAIVIILYALLGFGGLVLALMSLMFLVPSVAMGMQYQKQSSSGTAVTAGIIGFIVVLLLMLLISSALGVNITEQFINVLKSDANLMSSVNSLLQSEDQLDSFIDVMISMIPMMIIILAVYYTLITHWVARKLLTRYWKPVPKLKPIKDWMLPRSMVWYYLIVLVLDLVLEFDTGSVVSVIVINSLPLLTYAFAIQAIGFLFFVTDLKGWNRAMPIVAIILLPFFPSLLAWLGVIDVAFHLRNWAKEKIGNKP